MNRRQVSGVLLSGLVLGPSGCALLRPPSDRGRDAVRKPIIDPPRRPGKPLVLIAMPDAGAFHLVRDTLADELNKLFDVVTFVVNRTTSRDDLARAIAQTNPQCAVLMDNPAVKLFGEFERSLPSKGPGLPVVLVMCSFTEELCAEVSNGTGISYEVPGVTAVTNLRSVLSRTVDRVGVIHRPEFRRFIAKQRSLAEKEEIYLVAVEVDTNPSEQDIRLALKTFRRAQKVDALWILNDNELLRSGRFINRVWRPELDILKVPVVVSVSSLVTGAATFGTFAVIPDHEALGVQAANLIRDLVQDGWHAKEHPVEPPLSTQNIALIKQMRDVFGLRPNSMERIDKVID